MGKISKRGLGKLVWTWGLAVFASSLIIRKVCRSQAEISHTFMEMFLNPIRFTDFYFIEILTSLFSFFQRSFFHSHCYIKLTLFRLQNYHEFSRFFFCGELYCFGDINGLDLTNFQIQAHHKTFPKEHVTFLFWWTLYSLQRLVAATFFININCYFPDQGKVGHHTSIFTETKVHFMRFIAQRHLLFNSS